MNVGITTAVEFLQKKGFVVEANPNTKITDEQFDLLKKEFSTDKVLKEKSERFLQERQTKERNKGSVAIEGYGPKEAKAKTTEQKAVVSGEWNLLSLSRNRFKNRRKHRLNSLW